MIFLLLDVVTFGEAEEWELRFRGEVGITTGEISEGLATDVVVEKEEGGLEELRKEYKPDSGSTLRMAGLMLSRGLREASITSDSFGDGKSL